MQKTLRSGVPFFEHPPLDAHPSLDWDSFRVLLALRQVQSFRAAEEILRMAPNTVRLRIKRLETKLGYEVLWIRRRGIELTPQGRRLCETLAPMEAAAYEASRLIDDPGRPLLSGPVRVAVTEGIGTFWLAPRLAGFAERHPRLTIELTCTMRPADLIDVEADIGIQLVEPQDSELLAMRLGTLHSTFFASPEYLGRYGSPTSLQDLRDNHRVVEQISPQVKHRDFDRLFPAKDREGFVSSSFNTSTAHYSAVAGGAGIGVLPTYLLGIGARVVPVGLKEHWSYPITLICRPHVRRTKRVAATIEWLKQMFDARALPFFRKEYVEPEKLLTSSSGAAGTNVGALRLLEPAIAT